jgi:hypothetical protein
MNKNVLTISKGCGCSEEGIGGIGTLPTEGSSSQQIIVRHKAGTEIGNVIKEYSELGKKIYELDDLILVKPIVALTNDNLIIAVGNTIAEIVFTGSIGEGTYPISIRSLTPDPGGVDLTVPFNFSLENVQAIVAGIAEQYTLSATDDQGNVSTVVSKVLAKHIMYQGYNTLSILDETQVKELANQNLNDSIIAQYGGEQSYVVPGFAPQYIYWVGPVGTTMIAAAALSGFALPLVSLGTIDVVNQYDAGISTPHWLIRTANKFNPGTYSIETQ